LDDVRPEEQSRAPGGRRGSQALPGVRDDHPAQRAPERGAVARQAGAALRRAEQGRAGVSLAGAGDPRRPRESRERREGAARRSGTSRAMTAADPKRRALGRGLDALLPAAPAQRSPSYGEGAVFTCPLEKIVPQKGQPRQHFDPQKLDELAASI